MIILSLIQKLQKKNRENFQIKMCVEIHKSNIIEKKVQKDINYMFYVLIASI